MRPSGAPAYRYRRADGRADPTPTEPAETSADEGDERARTRKLAVAALSSRPLRDVSFDPRVRVDRFFSHPLRSPVRVANQEASGTCWLHAAAVLVDYEAQRQKLKDVRASVRYWQFYDKFEKAMHFLARCSRALREARDQRKRPSTALKLALDDPVSDGGTFGMFQFLLRKYGVMPTELFDGSYQAKHTAQINAALRSYLRASASLLAEGRKTLDACEREVLELLRRAYGGLPPATVRLHRQKHGLEFEGSAKELGLRIAPTGFGDLVGLVSVPDRRLGWYCTAHSNDRDAPDQHFVLNVEYETLRAACERSVRADRPVYFTADVRHMASVERGVFDVGIYDAPLLLGYEDMHLSRRERCKVRDVAPVHAMTVTGAHVERGGDAPIRWRVHNSYGQTHDDCIVMSDAWFREFGFEVRVRVGDVGGGATAAPARRADYTKLGPLDILCTSASTGGAATLDERSTSPARQTSNARCRARGGGRASPGTSASSSSPCTPPRRGAQRNTSSSRSKSSSRSPNGGAPDEGAAALGHGATPGSARSAASRCVAPRTATSQVA